MLLLFFQSLLHYITTGEKDVFSSDRVSCVNEVRNMWQLWANCRQILALCCLLIMWNMPVQAVSLQQAPNLLRNGQFDAGEAEWTLCSGARIVDDMAFNGRQALRLGPPTGFGCVRSEPIDLGPVQVAYQEVRIPADAEAVTVSFWYARRGNPDQGENQLAVAFVRDPDAITRDIQLDRVYGYELPGWTQYRQVLNTSQLEQARGQTWLFAFQLERAATGNNDINFLIDDVRIQVARGRTTATALPAVLRGDSNQPVVVTQFDPDTSTDERSRFALFRTNTDGTQRQRIYTGLRGEPNLATWSPDGAQIAVVDSSVSNPEDASQSGLIGIISILDPDGRNVREVYRSFGGGGEIGPPERPNIDTRITSIAWSPDSRMIGATICGSLRGTGGTTDEVCWLDLIDVATGEHLQRIENAFSFDWSVNNRILYSTTSFSATPPGIYELDLTREGAEPTRLLPNWSNRTPFRGQRYPVWAPDGQRFVVTQDVAGQHSATDGNTRSNAALVLYDRDQLTAPQMMLLVDHGLILGKPAWSPDGRYILYSLFDSDAGPASVWWLDSTTGDTGPLLVNEASISANWRTTDEPDRIPAGIRVFLPLIQR